MGTAVRGCVPFCHWRVTYPKINNSTNNSQGFDPGTSATETRRLTNSAVSSRFLWPVWLFSGSTGVSAAARFARQPGAEAGAALLGVPSPSPAAALSGDALPRRAALRSVSQRSSEPLAGGCLGGC